MKRVSVVSVAAATVLFLFGGLIYVTTDRGRTEVEFHDVDVQVAGLRGGRELALLERETGSEGQLRSGAYEIALKSDRNDVRLNREKLTLSRDREKIGEILPDSPPSSTARLAEASSPIPTTAGNAARPNPQLDSAPSATPKATPLEDAARGPFGEIRRFEAGGIVGSVRFSPDGRYLLTGSNSDGKLFLRAWNVDSGKPETQFRGHAGPYHHAFLPSGLKVLGIGDPALNEWALKEWDFKTGVESRQFGQIDRQTYTTMVTTRDGRRAITGAFNGIVQLWDVASGTELARLQLASTDPVWAVAVSPDARYALAGFPNGALHLLDLTTRKEVRQFKGHTKYVNALAFTTDGRQVVSAGYEPSIRVWDLNTGQETRQFALGDGSKIVSTIELSKDGNLLLTSGDTSEGHSGINLGDFRTGKKVWAWTLPVAKPAWSAAFSPDGRYVAGGWEDGFAYLFRVPNDRERESKPGVTSPSKAKSAEGKTKTQSATTKAKEGGAASKKTASPKDQAASPPEFRAVLEQACKQSNLPAIGAAVIVDGKVVAVDAVGVRKLGVRVPVKPDDAFHIGSCAKAMTATVIGVLVDSGKLRWNTTLAEAFPQLQGTMHASYRTVTVEQLLAHRGGFPRDPPGMSPPDVNNLPGRTAREKRLALVDRVLRQAPAAQPGNQFEYSNVGYTIVGAIAEQATNKQWESLQKDLLFNPLGMRGVHYGEAPAGGQNAQPWGHLSMGGQVTPIAPGPHPNNPPAMSPAGSVVHCSMADLARFAAMHLGEQAGGKPFLKPDTLKRLHTPLVAADGYAAGWGVVQWGSETGLLHAGATPMNFCSIGLAPNRKFAVVVATNIGPDRAAIACQNVAAQLMQMYLK